MLVFLFLLYIIYLITIGLNCFSGRVTEHSYIIQIRVVDFIDFQFEIRKEFFIQLYHFYFHFRNHETQSH